MLIHAKADLLDIIFRRTIVKTNNYGLPKGLAQASVVFSLFLGLIFAHQASALVIHTGQDPDGATTNSYAAFATWQASVGGVFDQDTMAGFDDTSTTAGNTFTGTHNNIWADDFTDGVIHGENMAVSSGDSDGGFHWTLAVPADAFGFFGYDNDQGTITVSFNDGTNRSFTHVADSSFWGVTGLNALVTSVSVTTTDPGGQSHYDNFVTASTGVPEPSAIALMGLGLLVFVATRRRKIQA